MQLQEILDVRLTSAWKQQAPQNPMLSNTYMKPHVLVVSLYKTSI